MAWFLTLPGYQQLWYWLCEIGNFLSIFKSESQQPMTLQCQEMIWNVNTFSYFINTFHHIRDTKLHGFVTNWWIFFSGYGWRSHVQVSIDQLWCAWILWWHYWWCKFSRCNQWITQHNCMYLKICIGDKETFVSVIIYNHAKVKQRKTKWK